MGGGTRYTERNNHKLLKKNNLNSMFCACGDISGTTPPIWQQFINPARHPAQRPVRDRLKRFDDRLTVQRTANPILPRTHNLSSFEQCVPRSVVIVVTAHAPSTDMQCGRKVTIRLRRRCVLVERPQNPTLQPSNCRLLILWI